VDGLEPAGIRNEGLIGLLGLGEARMVVAGRHIGGPEQLFFLQVDGEVVVIEGVEEIAYFGRIHGIGLNQEDRAVKGSLPGDRGMVIL
jgi:hypothetical protein